MKLFAMSEIQAVLWGPLPETVESFRGGQQVSYIREIHTLKSFTAFVSGATTHSWRMITRGTYRWWRTATRRWWQRKTPEGAKIGALATKILQNREKVKIVGCPARPPTYDLIRGRGLSDTSQIEQPSILKHTHIPRFKNEPYKLH